MRGLLEWLKWQGGTDMEVKKLIMVYKGKLSIIGFGTLNVVTHHVDMQIQNSKKKHLSQILSNTFL